MKFDTTYLAVDLDAIDENFHQVKSKTGCKVLSVVKADAYSHGAVPMARYLENCSDFFGVSCMSEAMELPIYIPALTGPIFESWTFQLLYKI